MTKETMIKNYRKFSAADAYMLGFVYKKNIYAIAVDEIKPRWINVERESSAKGGRRKLQLRLHAADIDLFMRKGAKFLCSVKDFPLASNYNNAGVALECVISEQNGIPFRGKENFGFWYDGDLTIDGVSYQIKMDGAQIVVENTLETLKKLERMGVEFPPKIDRWTFHRIAKARA